MMKRTLIWAFAGLLASPAAAAGATNKTARSAQPEEDAQWTAFRETRAADLELLGQALLECANQKAKAKTPECLEREETFEVAHGLTALFRITGEDRYAQAADKVIDRNAIADDNIGSLSPYATAWLIALARERQLASRKSDLRSAGNAAAKHLEAWLTGLDDHSLTQGLLFGSERSVAWAVTNLWSWARFTGDTAMAARLEDFTAKRVLQQDMDSWCPLPVDSQPEAYEFLPPCLYRAAAVLAVMPQSKSNKWLKEFMAAQTGLEPIHNAAWSTHSNLNFSRAWGLWSLYTATGESRYRSGFLKHVGVQMTAIKRAAKADPWLATFGVYALALTQ